MFDFTNEIILPFTFALHSYTLTTTGMKKKIDRIFASRIAANDYMYKLVAKYDLQLLKVWDDGHFKTYCYNNGIKIYINRM